MHLRLLCGAVLALFLMASARMPLVADEPFSAAERRALEEGLAERVASLTARLERERDSVEVYSRRGDARFFLGDFLGAVRDYEATVRLDAQLEKSHWRRGIAYFYAGRFRDAARQFEIYHTFDDVDRENGIWRYLSQASAYGLERAREGLLKYRKTDREPFPDVYRMFSGELSGAEVLERISKSEIPDVERDKRLFYADLYVGLNDALEGRGERAAKHLRRAVANRWGQRAGFGPNYMWHVGRVHLDRFVAVGKLPGLREALDRTVSRGRVVQIEGPPRRERDSERESNSVAAAERVVGPRRALEDGVYSRCRAGWLTVENPGASLAEIARLARQRYESHVLKRIAAPQVSRIEVEPVTLVYPPGYHRNDRDAKVHARRLKIHAVDTSGGERFLVAYFLNYDRVDPRRRGVLLQVNGHFGRNPSRQAIGLENRGGLTGAPVGKLAIAGYPIITYDDHDVGESSAAKGADKGLRGTLAVLRLLDEALLVHFDRVDALGLSGGCERLYHFLALRRSNLRSAYCAGLFTSPWCRLDTKKRTGGPFASDADTDDEVFQSRFQWADLALVGIADGVDVAFAHATYEGGIGKNCFFKEMKPALEKYTKRFEIRGDDRDGDGRSDNGRDLSHEYDLEDYVEWLRARR